MVELLLPAFSRFLDADLTLTYVGEGGMALPILGLTLPALSALKSDFRFHA